MAAAQGGAVRRAAAVLRPLGVGGEINLWLINLRGYRGLLAVPAGLEPCQSALCLGSRVEACCFA